ncbi:SOUL family heme-binding protein [Bythopirellula goksoeyrii]|uniref:SOUL heme-binding protein n=1 Tax=Bythopirellula goksoeyrii TaxID=1400387 RepID=A0A5B9QA96_9BACT|nr:heme-binding protein [Bythopirellula goksoeyrii]QEG35984.1 SOUL heme-binding protein [Bythopirellula goksoeyrii]
MSVKKMIHLTIAAVVVVVVYFGWKLTSRSAYESAEYTVLESDDSFEIREYPDLMMATTDIKQGSQGNDGSFMRLFDYISGENELKQKVAMTTPVFMEQDTADTEGQMGFVLPKQVAEQTIPDPSDDKVEIRKRAGGKFAVIRFAGRMDSKTIAAAEDKLRNWMKEKGLVGDGETVLAGYDPPWTPGPLRRNEALIRLH